MEHTANKILSQLLPDTVSQLPKHDLVFGSPINDPVAGIPLGDGDTATRFIKELMKLYDRVTWYLPKARREHSAVRHHARVLC